MTLEGTVALVTGAARRVGRAIALELARAGCDVAIHYRRSEGDARELAEEVRALKRKGTVIRADLSEPESWPFIIERTVEKMGRLDVLVNNASEFHAVPLDVNEAFDQVGWERTLRVNLVAPASLSYHARRHLKSHGQGKIINLTDIQAERPTPSNLVYCVSKAALDALTKGLARAFAPDIQVTGVALGIAEFPDGYSESLRQKLINQVPLRRAGTPQEVAQVVRFLVESGDFVTGEIVRLDGGRSCA
ncbi:MAG: SDR family oxidoreductase [Phycisphaerales bacterium]|nr:MAG: SDR family oxidoreductase [Phycisphaerales bacterium]